MITGAAVSAEHYKATDPRGKAFLKAADYQEPHEIPDDKYPFWLTTGRVVYQFHTRTKTARSKALNDAAPDSFVQIAAEDADRLGIAEGEMVEVASRRGHVRVAARIGDIIPGHAFIPFHYGSWDHPGHPRAANELTIFEWDPVSKQPHFKYAAVSLAKATPATHAKDIAGAVAEGVGSVAATVREAVKSDEVWASGKMHVANYLGLVRRSEGHLAESFRAVSKHHAKELDVFHPTQLLASWSDENEKALEPLVARYEESKEKEPGDLHRALFHGPRSGGLGLLRDLHDLWLLTQEIKLCYELLAKAALALRDAEMESILGRTSTQTHRQVDWLHTRIAAAASQALTVPS